MVGKAGLYPEMEGLVVTLSVCVGWLHAVVTTMHAQLIYLLPQCVNGHLPVSKSDVLVCGQTLISDSTLCTQPQSYFVFLAVS